MNLLEISLAEERSEIGNSILAKHKRNDLTIVAINKMYDHSNVCEGSNGALSYYLISETTFRRDYSVSNHFGPNYILLDDKYSDYESVRLNKGKYYTCCSSRELKNYLNDGWEIEFDKK